MKKASVARSRRESAVFRYLILRSLFFLVWTSAAVAQTATEAVDPARFREHIAYLASDELEGRGVGSKGIDLAAEYIAKQFSELGLSPAGEDGTFFQTFPFALHRKLTDRSRLTFAGDSTQRRQGVDFIPITVSSDDEFSGLLVFCGYGIENPEKSYDDFSKVDLSGAVVLIFDGEPPSWSDGDGRTTRHAALSNKVYNVKDRGGAAVLLVSPSPLVDGEDRLAEFVGESADQYGIPAFQITRSTAEWATTAGGLGSLDDLQKKLDAGSNTSGILGHIRASGQGVIDKETAPARNVLGKIRGKGPRADEWVIVGAHYDHLGVRRPMARKFKAGRLVREESKPEIHNGADDNASGTSGLIEAARLFAASPPPERSVLFIAFTAEESGLHGSKHYMEHPAVPLEKTVAMLNMDMIGRLSTADQTVQVFGADVGSSFTSLLEQAEGDVGLKTAPGVDFGGRSDHAVFVQKKIPSMHFYSGAHDDYHKPSDDTDKINVEGGAKVATLVFRVARELANAAEAPQFVESKAKNPAPAPAAGSTPTYRVVMGLMPSYADDGQKGMKVDAVSADGPADLAGMKAGDRIVRINDKPVANIYDYMASTRNNNPGDTVEVVILRDGREHTLRITLSGAR